MRICRVRAADNFGSPVICLNMVFQLQLILAVRRNPDRHRFNVPADPKGKGSNLLYRWQSQCQVNEIHRRVRIAVYRSYSIWTLREVVGNQTRTYTYIFGGGKCKTINKMTQVVH